MRRILDLLSNLNRVPYWVFIILFLVSGIVAVSALRANNQKMVELREAVYAADKTGGDTETALRNLREHVHSHMNTNLASGGNAIRPPIQLKYTYERLLQAEKKKAGASEEEIYTEAQAYCERQNPTGFSGGTRVVCIEQYVTTRGSQAISIPVSLYQFDFVSPTWSPDLAGWSLVLTTLLLFALVLRFLIERLLISKLKSD